MINAGIIGGAGYTAGELLRTLIHHPQVNIVSVMSASQIGNKVSHIHTDLEGDLNLEFSDRIDQSCQIVFLCSGHGKSKAVVESNLIPQGAKIIDLSSDYRIKGSHDFVYGLPELNREKIKTARRVANPGCFATCIQLSVLPLAARGALTNDVHIAAITGSTGAGQNQSVYTHFSWRSNNASVYKAFTHQHLAEIRQSLGELQEGFSRDLHFIPMRGAFTRGILAACYLKTEVSAEAAKIWFSDFYSDHPFVLVSKSQLHNL